jgi:hypothetical protein
MFKFWKNLLYYIVIKNPVKLTLLGISIIGILLIYQVDDLIIRKTPISKFSDAGKIHVVYLSGNDYKIKSFEKEPILKDGKVIYTETHPVVVISFLITFILLIILVVLTFIGIDDSDNGWSLGDCIIDAKMSLIKCEWEDGVYYFHYKGKLIIKSDNQPGVSQLERLIQSPINIFPDFPGTKSQRRDKKLKELFK